MAALISYHNHICLDFKLLLSIHNSYSISCKRILVLLLLRGATLYIFSYDVKLSRPELLVEEVARVTSRNLIEFSVYKSSYL